MIVNYKSVKNKFKLRVKENKFFDISDVYFDDRDHKVKFIVSRLNKWFRSKKILLPINLIIGSDPFLSILYTGLNKYEFENSALDLHDLIPVCQQKELAEKSKPATHSSWNGNTVYPGGLQNVYNLILLQDAKKNPNLRSVAEVIKYEVINNKGIKVGMIKDLYIDLENWQIYFISVMKRSETLRSNEVFIGIDEIQEINYKEAKIILMCNSIKIEDCSSIIKPELGIDGEDADKLAQRWTSCIKDPQHTHTKETNLQPEIEQYENFNHALNTWQEFQGENLNLFKTIMSSSKTHLPRGIKELIAFVVSKNSNCNYFAATHCQSPQT